jgi:CBS domain-containing protein
MRCDEIMKRDVEFVSPRDTVEDAAIRMKDHGIGFLPVCDESRRVVGTLTDRDITIRVLAARKPPSTFVEEVMSDEVTSCPPDDDVEDARGTMAENHKARIVCCDEDGRLLGVISLSDLAQYAEVEAASETLREVSEREART